MDVIKKGTNMAKYEEIKPSGVTDGTPKNIMLGAGTLHKGLEFAPSTGILNFEESLFGATSGGTKVKIEPELIDIDVDGVLVKAKGLTVKQGESATLETNMIELTPEFMKTTIIGQDGTSTATGYDVIESKQQIEDGDYIENLGFIGRKTDGTPIIIIFDNALCTSGFEVEGKNKESGTVKATFECYADLTSDTSILPYHIYTPTPSI